MFGQGVDTEQEWAKKPQARGKQPDNLIFWGFLVLLVWAPIPNAGVRAWAWGVMDIWVYTLVAGWLLLLMRGQVHIPQIILRARTPLILLGVWLLYQGLYLIPLPPGLIALVSPNTAEMYAQVAGFRDTAWFPLSLQPDGTEQALLKGSSYVLMFLLTLLLVRSERRMVLLIRVLVFSGLFQAAYGASMVLTGLEYGFLVEKDYMRGLATGTFVARTHLAAYLNLCLGLGIGLLLARPYTGSLATWKARARAVLNWLFSADLRLRLYLMVMVVAVVMTHSRMGNAAFFASLLLVGLLALFTSKHASRRTVRLIVSLIVIDILVVGSWFGLSQVVERIGRTDLETSDRAEYNEATLALIRDYPLLGTGPGSYQAALTRYKVRIYLGGYIDHGHNDYLEFTAENGIIGFLILATFVSLAFVTALRVHYRRHSPTMRGITFGVMMSIVALLIQLTVDFPLQIPAIALTFMVILALPWLTAHLNPGNHAEDGDEPEERLVVM